MKKEGNSLMGSSSQVGACSLTRSDSKQVAQRSPNPNAKSEEMEIQETMGEAECDELCETCSWKKPHFFKVLMGDFHESVKIPPAFLKHLASADSATAVIKDHANRGWKIELLKRDNGMILGNGWKKFVERNVLETGDFLVFQYDGDLHFTVTIFDKSSCEKNFHVGKSSAIQNTYLVPDETHGRKREQPSSDENEKRKRQKTNAREAAFKTTNPNFKAVMPNTKRYKCCISVPLW